MNKFGKLNRILMASGAGLILLGAACEGFWNISWLGYPLVILGIIVFIFGKFMGD